MSIKKHQIKISLDKQNSGFVIDLRSEKKKKKNNYLFPATENFFEYSSDNKRGHWRSEVKKGKNVFSRLAKIFQKKKKKKRK